MSNQADSMAWSGEWREALVRSKAQIAAGESVPLLPVLDRLRETAERIEVEQGLSPDGVKLSIER